MPWKNSCKAHELRGKFGVVRISGVIGPHEPPALREVANDGSADSVCRTTDKYPGNHEYDFMAHKTIGAIKPENLREISARS